MILNLFADAKDPVTLRDQINASLAEISAALGDALIGEIVYARDVSASGAYRHKLGVKPIIALFMAGPATGSMKSLSRPDWTDTDVVLSAGETPVGLPDGTVVLLVARV